VDRALNQLFLGLTVVGLLMMLGSMYLTFVMYKRLSRRAAAVEGGNSKGKTVDRGDSFSTNREQDEQSPSRLKEHSAEDVLVSAARRHEEAVVII
jgi:hypothetical protein